MTAHALQADFDGSARTDDDEPNPAAAEQRLSEAIALLQSVNLPADRLIGQLLHGGHDPARIRARFPETPEAWLQRARRARHLAPTTPTPAAAAPPAPATLINNPPVSNPPLERLLQRLQAAPSGAAAVPNGAATSGQGARIPVAPAKATALDLTSDGLSFQYVPLIQCSFPHADPGEVTTFTRRNGWLELTLATHKPAVGLPYGVPARLLTIYLSSEAIRTRSPEIFLGDSVHDFLRRLDVPITRGERGSLRVYANQLLRLIHCSVSIDENLRDSTGRTGLHIRQALFAEEARLWWDDEPHHAIGAGSSLRLSPVLFDSILERCAPLSTAAIRALRKSPMDLDVYAWLAHRLFHLERPSRITWPQLSGQFGHGYKHLRMFRHFFSDSLRRVRAVYPTANIALGENGVILLPSPPHVARLTRA